jgi:hypothetical protein
VHLEKRSGESFLPKTPAKGQTKRGVHQTVSKALPLPRPVSGKFHFPAQGATVYDAEGSVAESLA